MTNRIAARFARLAEERRAGLITFITAADPDAETCGHILRGLPAAGADLIELGMPFSDPMADGPAIQASSLRALRAGGSMAVTLDLLRAFRLEDQATPVVLFGYYNPIHRYGVPAFLRDALAAGADGLLIVDLPPEEDRELAEPARAIGLDFIRLATPTTDAARLPQVLAASSGFLYYVSIAGITGTRAPDLADVAANVTRIRRDTALPIAIGFGIRTAEQAARIAALGDAVVVGSALVEAIGQSPDDPVAAVLGLVGRLAAGIKAGRAAHG